MAAQALGKKAGGAFWSGAITTASQDDAANAFR